MDKKAPLTFNIASWYGFFIAVVFLVYGGVKIVLGFMDNNFENLPQLVMFTVIGIILVTIAAGFRQFQKWGWYGLIGLNCLLILGSLYDIIFAAAGSSLVVENIVLIILSAVALYALFSSATKNYLKIAA